MTKGFQIKHNGWKPFEERQCGTLRRMSLEHDTAVKGNESQLKSCSKFDIFVKKI